MKKKELKFVFHNPNTDMEEYSKYIAKKILDINFNTIKQSVCYEKHESPDV